MQLSSFCQSRHFCCKMGRKKKATSESPGKTTNYLKTLDIKKKTGIREYCWIIGSSVFICDSLL